MRHPLFPLITLVLAGASLLGTTSARSEEAAPATAPASPYTLTGNVAVVSDYRFRGITNTARKPALQAGIDLAHASGFYGGLWASNVGNAAYNNTDGFEVDAYAGYRYALTEALQVDAGLYTYWYPGAVVHFTSGLSGRTTDVEYHTRELRLALNYGAWSMAGWVSVGRYWFGYFATDAQGDPVDVRGSNYLEVNWNPELGDGYTLNLHAGRQQLSGLHDANFEDVRVGVTKVFDGQWQLGLAALHNNGRRSSWTFVDNRDGSGRYAAGTSVVLSAQRNF